MRSIYIVNRNNTCTTQCGTYTLYRIIRTMQYR